MNRSTTRGFTLIEVLLSVAIISMLVGISAPIYESFVRRNDLELTTQQLVAALRRAASYARATKDDSVWGVRVQANSATLYRGNDFATRNTVFDETILIPSSITPTGVNDIQFSKLKALPNTTGTITLASTANATKILTINAKGMVDY